jgi:hypothetical protein
MMDISTLDSDLIAAYESFDVPVDQFIGNPDLAEAFAASLQKQSGGVGMDWQAITRRLLYLRKRGRLPRLRRAYHGRNSNN